MIPTIGIMIGLYILTRMVELLAGNSKIFPKVLASITALGSIVGIIALLSDGASLPDLGRIRSTSASSSSTLPIIPALPDSLVSLAGSTSGWHVTESKNPLDDSPTVVLMLESISGSSRFGESPTLILRCTAHKTDAYINWNDYMGSDAVNVTIRIGRAAASARDWSLSTDSKATFYPGSTVAFIKSLMTVDTLVARATPYNDSPVTAIFPVAGLSGKVGSLQTACGWK